MVTKSLDLDSIQKMVSEQAEKRGWRRDAIYCIKRIKEDNGELEELEQAIKHGGRKDIMHEIIDNIYFLVQVAKDKCPEYSLNTAFQEKYMDNEIKPKKTEDSKGRRVLR